MDITSLYTVIPNDEGLRALRHFFDQRTVKETSSETLLRLAELALTLNCFSFIVTTTNKLMAWPWILKWDPATPIFLQVLSNTNFLSQYPGPKPELYGRYIDDCIGATSSTREEPTQLITAVNSFHPALKYTWEISDTSLAFPDIKISIKDN